MIMFISREALFTWAFLGFAWYSILAIIAIGGVILGVVLGLNDVKKIRKARQEMVDKTNG